MRYRMPDVFIAGYEGCWLPPPTKGEDGSGDIGYALFDRFDLGTNDEPTRYGTEAGFRLLIDNYHRANVEVYVDWIMNHNGTRDNNSSGFIAQGGYPGFVLETAGDSFGDFHTYNNPCPQSTNPNDPCYDLYNGRLLGLIDIDQFKNHQYIRQPVAAGNPANIPAGTLYNQPDPDNTRFYPDQNLPGEFVFNPGTTRWPNSIGVTIYPFNVADPAAGDAVSENALGLLVRSTQWFLEDVGVDGFRLDAAKHISSLFWDRYWDTWVYMRRIGFDGNPATPYSFVEVVADNNFTAEFVRKPGEPGSGQGWPASGWEFGNRDALDLNEAGALRDLASAQGLGSWGNIIGSSVDNVDGFNNGTIGVHHVNSHDNAVSPSINDTVEHAYVLMRTGPAIVYHNALQFGPSGIDFPRNNSRADALGLGDNLITRLVQIRNEYARGWFIPINDTEPNPGLRSTDDVLLFTRRTPTTGPDNVLIGLNDRYDSGFQTRTVATTFPVGARLRELTGNATDSLVDPNDNIVDVLTVGAGGFVTISVPNNRNVNGVVHGRGYVIYGPAVPSGTLTLTNVATTIPPDDASEPDYLQRVNPVHVMTADSFEIQLQTTQTDPLDPDTDDNALFRIDSGFTDSNNNAVIDNPTGDNAGYEAFLTQNSPLFGGGSGTYRQVIDATGLSEGLHFISVRAFRHRTTGMPLFADFRAAILVDRLPPQITLVSPTQTGNGDILSPFFIAEVEVDDPDVANVHMFFDKHESTDFVGMAEGGLGTMTRLGPTSYEIFLNGAKKGNHRLDVVVFDQAGTPTQATFTGINATTSFYGGLGDINDDFAINGKDIAPFVQLATGAAISFNAAADFNGDGLNDVGDLPMFVDALVSGP